MNVYSRVGRIVLPPYHRTHISLELRSPTNARLVGDFLLVLCCQTKFLQAIQAYTLKCKLFSLYIRCFSEKICSPVVNGHDVSKISLVLVFSILSLVIPP